MPAQIIKFPNTKLENTEQERPGAIPSTLLALRERRGLTQKDVEHQLNKPKGWVSKVEKGKLQLSENELSRYAVVLKAKPELLSIELPKIDNETVVFRKYNTAQRTIDLIKAEAKVRTLTLQNLADSAGYSTAPNFAEYDCSVEGGAEAVAHIYRDRWGLLDNPIDDLTGFIEREGITVTQLPLLGGKVAGITTHQTDRTCYLMMINPTIHENTQRFTLAHELGHLAMDRLSPELEPKEIEKRADQFAGELLAPYLYVQDDIRRLKTGDVATLRKLTERWGLHPTSFIVRGKQHGDISAHQATNWYKAINAQKLLIEATPAPYPVERKRFGLFVQDLEKNEWAVPDVTDQSFLFTDELIDLIGPSNWPYQLHSLATARRERFSAV